MAFRLRPKPFGGVFMSCQPRIRNALVQRIASGAKILTNRVLDSRGFTLANLFTPYV
jgi:hypothetical protein